MDYTLKNELYAYFRDIKDRTETEEQLYNKLKYALHVFDIVSVDRDDLGSRNFKGEDATDAQMLRLADRMCEYYLDSGNFSEDLGLAAEEAEIEQSEQP